MRTTRARLAVAGPAVDEGKVEARVAFRGITLADHDERPDVCDWLCDVLGLDGWGGDTVNARISVDLIDDPIVTDPGDRERRAATEAEQADRKPPEEQQGQNNRPEEPDEHDPA